MDRCNANRRASRGDDVETTSRLAWGTKRSDILFTSLSQTTF